MIAVVWLQHDIRIHDNAPLKAALDSGLPVVFVYAKTFNHKRFKVNASPLKKAYLNQTLEALRQLCEPYNIPLLVYENDIITALNLLGKTMKIAQVYAYASDSIFEKDAQDQVKKAWPITLFEGRTLIHFSDAPFSVFDTPRSFTNFRKRVESRFFVRKPIQVTLKRQEPLPINSTKLDLLEVPLIVEAGEKAGLKRLSYYLEETHKIKTYKETRNGMDDFDDSTKFSFYISVGALSVRTIYFKIKEYENTYGKNDSTYWVIFELLWRDFFKYQEKKDPFKMVHKHGIQEKVIDWPNHPSFLEAIKTGKTGYPLIDANILELLSTGYMSNRGRQNVASFWVKNLGLDWRLGEAFFEHHLLDYDVASNTGNWQYITGIGNDSMPFRYFDVMGQGARYDQNHAYLLKWLPELKKVSFKDHYHLPLLKKEDWDLLPSSFTKNYHRPIVDFYESLNHMKKVYGEVL